MVATDRCRWWAWWWDRRDVQRPKVGVCRVGALGPWQRERIEARACPGGRAGRACTCASVFRSFVVARTVRDRRTAKDLIAAEYRHTTARGVSGAQAPDPQLHSHVVITCGGS